MTEAEIAALVAKAVADHEANQSWTQQLIEGIGVLLAAIGLIATACAVGVGIHIRTRLRLQSLEEYRVTHEAADRAAHDGLSRDTAHVDQVLQSMVEEQKEFRRESNEQHSALAKTVSSMARDLNRLIGYHEASRDKREAGD